MEFHSSKRPPFIGKARIGVGLTCLLMLVTLAGLSGSASAASFSSVQTISDQNDPNFINSTAPSVGLYGENGAVTAWLVSVSGNKWVVRAARRPNGGTAFGPPQTLSNPEDSISVYPKVLTNPSGAAVVVWAGATNQYSAAFKSPGGDFGAPVQLGLTLVGGNVDFALGEDGTFAVSWVTQAAQVLVKVQQPGGTLSNSIQASAQGFSAGIGVAPNGSVSALWGAGGLIRIAELPAGGQSFGAATVISPAGESAGMPGVRFDSSGGAVAFWYVQIGGAVYRLRAAIRPAGSSVFNASQELAVGSITRLSFDLAPSGDAVIAWNQASATDSLVKASVRPAGGSFGPAQALSAPNPAQTAYNVSSAVSTNGTAMVVWDRSDGLNTRTQVAIGSAASGSFAPATNISGAGYNIITPKVAFNSGGDAVAIWTNTDNLRSIEMAVYDGTGPKLGGLTVPTDASINTQASFSVQASDSWSEPVSLSWDFGDGTVLNVPASTQTVSHTYTTAGTYQVKLKATDAAGNVTNSESSIKVVDPNAPAPKQEDKGITQPPVVTPTPTPPVVVATDTAPRSGITKLAKAAKAKKLKSFRGTARDDHGVKLVELSLVRKGSKSTCFALRANGKFIRYKAKSGKCANRFLVKASGTKSWTYKLKRALPKGSYTLVSRATDTAGQKEAKFSVSRKNLATFKLK